MGNKQPIEQQLEANVASKILENLPWAMLVTDKNGKIRWCNEALSQLLKVPTTDLIDQEITEMEKHHLKPLQDQPEVFFIMGKESAEPEFWLQKHLISLPDDDASAIAYSDITQLTIEQSRSAEMQRKLDELSTVDPVSGLLNRRAMLQNLEPLVSRSRRYGNPLSVIAMDILNLEAIAQQNGETAVTHAVKQVSFMLKDTLRWADLVSRIEENRFIFILPETDKESAVHLTNKINNQISELTVNFDGQELVIQACYGVASWEKGNDTVLLLRHATQSLEIAKQNGPGMIQDC